MLRFHVHELGKRGANAQLLRVAHVDPARQRLHQPLESFTAQATPDEVGQAFIFLSRSSRHEAFGRQPQLAPETQDRRGHERPDTLRGHQRQAIRYATESPAADDVDSPLVGVGPDQIIRQPDLSTEIDALGQSAQHAVGADFQPEALDLFGLQHAPGCLPGLEQMDFAPVVEQCIVGLELIGGRQTADAATDNRHSSVKMGHAVACCPATLSRPPACFLEY